MGLPQTRVMTSDSALGFFCVGAQKAGTTTLHDTLARHAEIFLPARKETHFFARDARYERGIDYYHSEYFSEWQPGQMAGEVDPEYIYFPEAAPRIHSYSPRARIIVMLRNPVERAYSHYLMSVRRGFEKQTFEEALARESSRLAEGEFERIHFSYADRGFYALQIRRFLDLFPAEQLAFVVMDELLAQPDIVLSRVCRFLGVAPLPPGTPLGHGNPAARPRSVWLSRVLHGKSPVRRLGKRLFAPDGGVAGLARALRRGNLARLDPEPVEAATRRDLIERFRDDVTELEQITGRDLSAWLEAT